MVLRSFVYSSSSIPDRIACTIHIQYNKQLVAVS